MDNSNHDKMPEKFIICTSHRETTIDGKSFLTILGKEGNPWLAFSFWSYEGFPVLWVKKSKVWYRIIHIDSYMINFWIHLSMHIDMKEEKISISVNGDDFFHKDLPNLNLDKPLKLSGKVYLGLDIDNNGKWRQFVGSVDMVNILDTSDIRIENEMFGAYKIAKDMCMRNYADINWKLVGHATERLEVIENLIGEMSSYDLIIPAKIDLMQGYELCKKLGSGNMKLLKSKEDLEELLGKFHKVVSPCNSIWTPITDKRQEGVFRDMESESLVSYLPWDVAQGEPAGGNQQNYVVLDVEQEKYNDFVDYSTPYYRSCAACELWKNTTFTMTGTCKESFLGERFCYSFPY